MFGKSSVGESEADEEGKLSKVDLEDKKFDRKDSSLGCQVNGHVWSHHKVNFF